MVYGAVGNCHGDSASKARTALSTPLGPLLKRSHAGPSPQAIVGLCKSRGRCRELVQSAGSTSAFLDVYDAAENHHERSLNVALLSFRFRQAWCYKEVMHGYHEGH